MPSTTRVTLSAQYGGPEAGDVMQPIGNELKSRLRAVDSSYGADIDAVAITMFVSGSVTAFPGPSGWSNVKVMRASRRLTFDVTVQDDVVTSGREDIWTFLRETLSDAVRSIATKPSAKGLDFDTDALADAISVAVVPG